MRLFLVALWKPSMMVLRWVVSADHSAPAACRPHPLTVVLTLGWFVIWLCEVEWSWLQCRVEYMYSHLPAGGEASPGADTNSTLQRKASDARLAVRVRGIALSGMSSAEADGSRLADGVIRRWP